MTKYKILNLIINTLKMAYFKTREHAFFARGNINLIEAKKIALGAIGASYEQYFQHM